MQIKIYFSDLKPDDASTRLEQEAQWRAENQEPEPEKEDGEIPF